MTATTRRWIPAALVIALLLGGCTLGRTRSASAPREQVSPAALQADMQSLRQDYDSLQAQQRDLQKQMEELQSSLAKNLEEQQRFRQAMTKNFDLLEQSLAHKLTKLAESDRGAGPREQPAAPPQAQAAPAMGKATGEAMPAQPRVSAAQPTPAMMTDTAQPAAAPMKGGDIVPVAVAAREGEPEQPVRVEDPDLLPPEKPTLLSAHREAKPLYEKGFALFARKDYQQSVIVFENFLKRFPDDIYSDNAQFWIGEANLNLNRPADAEQAYRAVLRHYEHRSTLEGYKTPDAIYRLGQLAQNRGDTRRTRHYFEVLSERFPDTSAGRKALRELGTLGMNTAAR